MQKFSGAIDYLVYKSEQSNKTKYIVLLLDNQKEIKIE